MSNKNEAPNSQQQSPYRWVIITLAAATAILLIAMPSMSLSVMFDEIASDLNISIVQIGLIWGLSSFTGMILGLIGGILGDRFGARIVMITACVAVGLFGASRGFSTSFTTFMLASFFMGLFIPLASVNLHSVAGHWFTSQELGLANGIISSSFAGGFLFGAYFAASTLSPLLGGWRQVFMLYGALSIGLALAWWFLYPADTAESTHNLPRIPLREGLPIILRIPNIWFIGLGKIGVWGCVKGLTGYLPLYLRQIGWEPDVADSAVSIFFFASLLGAIPIPLLSDRLGVRKPFILLSALFVGSGALMIGFVDGALLFFAIVVGGVMFDAFMGIAITAASEIKEVSGALVGTGIGVIFLLSDIGGTIAPPLGNALATISPELPFFLWGGMAVLGSVSFAMMKESPRTA